MTKFKYRVKEADGSMWGTKYLSTDTGRDDYIELMFGRQGLPSGSEVVIEPVSTMINTPVNQQPWD